MQNANRQVLENGCWNGHELAAALNGPQYLNRLPVTRRGEFFSAVKRVVSIIEKAQDLRAYLTIPRGRRTAQLREIISSLDDLLPKSVELHATVTKRDEINFRWLPKRVNLSSSVMFDAVNSLAIILANGELEQLRRCKLESCRRWYFVGSRHEKAFCSHRCYEKLRRSTPEFKKGRRDYMREKYYPMVKSTRVKQRAK